MILRKMPEVSKKHAWQPKNMPDDPKKHAEVPKNMTENPKKHARWLKKKSLPYDTKKHAWHSQKMSTLVRQILLNQKKINDWNLPRTVQFSLWYLQYRPYPLHSTVHTTNKLILRSFAKQHTVVQSYWTTATIGCPRLLALEWVSPWNGPFQCQEPGAPNCSCC